VSEPSEQRDERVEGRARPERECLRQAIRSVDPGRMSRMMPLGERHFRRAITESVEHDISNGITKDSTIG
jgi:hypothetical protein